MVSVIPLSTLVITVAYMLKKEPTYQLCRVTGTTAPPIEEQTSPTPPGRPVDFGVEQREIRHMTTRRIDLRTVWKKVNKYYVVTRKGKNIGEATELQKYVIFVVMNNCT